MIGHCDFCCSVGALSDYKGHKLCDYCYDECVAMDEELEAWYEHEICKGLI